MDIETRKKIAASLRSAAAKLTAGAPPELIERLAKRHLGIWILETRNSDSLDFHDVWRLGPRPSVGNVKRALEEAYLAGFKDGKSEADLNR